MNGAAPHDDRQSVGGSSAEPPGPAGAGACEGCGATGDDLSPVHRIYLETDAQGHVVGSQQLEDVERWCLVCRTHYPHEAVPSG